MSSRGLETLSVLLVDDHLNMRRLWTAILKSFGITKIKEAEGAAEALEILRDEQVDLAIIDQILDDISGRELIEMIRRANDSSDPFLPVIACTADTRKPVIYDLIDAGADEILTKPVSPDAAWKRIIAVNQHRRDFVRTATYFGPDRRRVKDAKYRGPERRSKDESVFV